MWMQPIEAQTNPRVVMSRRAMWLATPVASDKSETLDV
jgi:hypothetical protein